MCNLILYWNYLSWITLIWIIKGIYPIKIVELEVPSKVRKGQAVQMSCLYDLQNQSLYSLKWFYRSTKHERDEKEFFRFTPNEKPHKRQFKLPNITVDFSTSSGGILKLNSINASGNYKCEISVEDTFQTVSAEKFLQIEDNYANQLSPSNKLIFITIIVFIVLVYSSSTLSSSSPSSSGSLSSSSGPHQYHHHIH